MGLAVLSTDDSGDHGYRENQYRAAKKTCFSSSVCQLGVHGSALLDRVLELDLLILGPRTFFLGLGVIELLLPLFLEVSHGSSSFGKGEPRRVKRVLARNCLSIFYNKTRHLTS